MVRTASSVAVRLTWQIDPQLPAGTRARRDLLLKDPVRLSEDDRQALHVFFRQRIEQARAANTAASWEEQLAEVFDYTAWHHFQVDVERGKGLGWEKLTSKLHGALSGGEKAIALHLPLFAAIAAHYQAVPLSPRIILLDEVFVGVDTVNRGQVFALLAALDLDLVLTSDHEWGTYRELDGIAVHQLETGSGLDQDDAVTSVRFTWDAPSCAPTPMTEWAQARRCARSGRRCTNGSPQGSRSARSGSGKTGTRTNGRRWRTFWGWSGSPLQAVRSRCRGSRPQWPRSAAPNCASWSSRWWARSVTAAASVPRPRTSGVSCGRSCGRARRFRPNRLCWSGFPTYRRAVGGRIGPGHAGAGLAGAERAGRPAG